MTTVPSSLRTWFVVHFWVDILVAMPLFVAPRALQSALGWTTFDPVAPRLVAAALFGIGVESLLVRNGNAESFRSMLNLKIIWSAAAMVGLVVALADGAPKAAWGLLLVFAAFNALWLRYRLLLRPANSARLRGGAS